MLAWFCRAAVVGLLAAASYAQPVAETRAPAPDLEGLAPLSAVPILETPPVDVSASRSADGPGEPYRFAEPFAVDVTPATHGLWETTSDGLTAVWRLRVRSAGAVSINLGFTRYRMPPGGRLRVHTPDGEDVVGPYTEADNKSHGELWTPLVSGDDAVIEVAVPADRVGDLELQLGSVNRGFRDLVATDPLRSHQSCHIDVACSQADPYRDQVRSVAQIVIDGRITCTGSLLNNTARDELAYAAASSDTSVAEASVSDSTVTVTGMAIGAATITVTATDVDGTNTSVSQTFDVEVVNRAPEPVGRLSGPGLQVGEGEETQEVSNSFQDPDGDALTSAAWSESPWAASVALSGP